MSTLAEIEAAVMQLPLPKQQKLFSFLAGRLGHSLNGRAKTLRRLKAAEYPALEGLPKELSVGTKERVRLLVAKRHAADC